MNWALPVDLHDGLVAQALANRSKSSREKGHQRKEHQTAQNAGRVHECI